MDDTLYLIINSIRQITYTTVPPPPPINIHLNIISDNSIFVMWDPPAANPSSRPLTYSVYAALDGGERFPVVGGINATNYTIMSESYCVYMHKLKAIPDL